MIFGFSMLSMLEMIISPYMNRPIPFPMSVLLFCRSPCAIISSDAGAHISAVPTIGTSANSAVSTPSSIGVLTPKM